MANTVEDSLDTIAAIATPVGVGGVGMIRISGPRAVHIVSELFRRTPDSFPDRYMVHGVVRDRAGDRLDDALAVVMRGPRSFTGEHVAEIHGHGGVVNMARLLRATITAGARHAQPGEFTRRAFDNGKIDLIRAEAIVDVIEASSERAWRLAQSHLDGALGTHVDGLRSRAVELLATVEACIDFPEEGEEYESHLEIADKAGQLASDIGDLARTFSVGTALRNGVEIAIVGPVNAGKSSLFNTLAQLDRAIVDESPGTTRDFVEVSVVWDGIPVTLIDTAGDRDTDNRVENQGIERGRRRASEADLRVHAVSAELSTTTTTVDVLDEHTERDLVVITKGDLLPEMSGQSDDGLAQHTSPPGALITSARTGQGIDALKTAIMQRVCGTAAEGDDSHMVTSERHRTLLEQAQTALAQVAQCVAARAPLKCWRSKSVTRANSSRGSSGMRSVTMCWTRCSASSASANSALRTQPENTTYSIRHTCHQKLGRYSRVTTIVDH